LLTSDLAVQTLAVAQRLWAPTRSRWRPPRPV